jgi:hypothetical protein
MAGAPPGNTNGAKKNRLLTDTLKRELIQNPDDALAIARKLIESAKAGESWAQVLIHDRVDGKVPQAIVGDDDEPALRIEKVERTIVKPNPETSGS